MLVQRRRRWTNIKTMQVQRFVFAGYPVGSTENLARLVGKLDWSALIIEEVNTPGAVLPSRTTWHQAQDVHQVLI